MDIPDSVLLDSTYGPQKVEMINIPPVPIYQGAQIYDPWNPDYEDSLTSSV